MDALIRDLRYAFRSLFKAPAFVAVVMLMLGIGIGANTAIFSLLDQAVLRSLAGIAHPRELVLIDGPGSFQGRTFNDATLSRPMYLKLRQGATTVAGIMAAFPTSLTAMWQGQAERLNAELVSGNFFQVLGVSSAAGRVFDDTDDVKPMGHPVVVLDHGYWLRRFGGDRSVIGQTIALNGVPMTIVGVAGAGFRGIDGNTVPDVYVPVMEKKAMTPTWDDLENERSRWLTVIARVKPGVARAAAFAELNGLYHAINADELTRMPGASARFKQAFLAKNLVLRNGARGRGVLDNNDSQYLTLMAMVMLVLFIVCANVANLMLARGASRNREMAVRLALGASRGQLIRQTFVESAVLSAGGLGVGLLVGLGGERALIHTLPAQAQQLLEAKIDLPMFFFAVGATALAAVLAGLGPALQVSRPSLARTMRDEAGSVLGGARQVRVRKALVGVQMALSVLLLIGATLFARTLVNVKAIDPGVTVDGVMTFSLDPGLSNYEGPRLEKFYEDVRRAMTHIPGVQSAAISEMGLLTESSWQQSVVVDGYTPKDGESVSPDFNGISPDFFRTMGIPILRGRDFTPSDVAGAQRVAIVSESFSKYFFNGQSPIGRTFRVGRTSNDPFTIVGEVKDIRAFSLKTEPARYIYMPAYQDSTLSFAAVYVKQAPGSPDISASIRQAVAGADPNVPVYDVLSFREQFNRSITQENLVAVLSSAFGVMATLLAAVGLYGVMSYTVARRTRELGVRMALGAEPGRVMRLVLRDVAALTITGAFAGAVVTYLSLRFAGARINGLIFGLSATDPVTYVIAFVVLTSVGLFAGFWPALRATRIQPTVALRTE